MNEFSLEIFDALIWVLNALLSIGCMIKYDDDNYKVYLILFVLCLSIVNHFIDKRPHFRYNVGSALICGFLSVLSALISLKSAHQVTSFSISLTFNLLFLFSDCKIPTEDFLLTLLFSIASSFLVTWIFNDDTFIVFVSTLFACFVLFAIMKHVKNSFSIGESIIVSTLCALPIRTLVSETGIKRFSSSFILGGELCLILSVLYKKPISSLAALSPLYFFLLYFFDLISFVFVPIHFAMLIYCGTVSVVFIILSIYWKGLSKFPQIIQRKFFHLMALFVFVPPALLCPSFWKVCLSGSIYFFLVFESLRVTKFPFFANILQSYVQDYLDEKDSGDLILTHLFLLLGCSLPVMFNSFSGFLGDAVSVSGISVLAIGDATASYVGVNFGRHKWFKSKKSIEGTMGAFVGTWLTIAVISMAKNNFQPIDILYLAIPSLIAALDEAFTTQIDNLTLPFVIIPSLCLVLNR